MAFNNPRPEQRGHRDDPPASGAGGAHPLVRAQKMMQIAFVLPAAVLVGWLVGVGLDRLLHAHWVYIAGILLGATAGFVQIFRLVLAPDADGGRE